MSAKQLTEHHLEFLSLKEGCTGSSESTLVKMPHCCKSHVMAHLHNKKFTIKSHEQAHFSRVIYHKAYLVEMIASVVRELALLVVVSVGNQPFVHVETLCQLMSALNWN